MTLIDAPLVLLALPAVIACTYLVLATLLSARLQAPRPYFQTLRFDVVVPAHNEAAGIERTVASLSKLSWPQSRFRVLVVADNCDDATAELAHRAGATVIERHDKSRRGKGYALDHAFRYSLHSGWADAVVIVDADTVVSTNLLEAFAARIEHGAKAVQAHYGVLNPTVSWRTRLITIALASFHTVRSRARERLHLSCGIRGNGWCVTHDLLKSVPYCAFSITEDIEYGVTLGLAGYRVHYADEAHVDGEMVSGDSVARKQRQRWEYGRFHLLQSRAMPLLFAAFRRRSMICLDLALDLLVLPLSYVALNIALLVVCASLISVWHHAALAWLWLSLACMVSLTLYVLRGWQLSGLSAISLVDLAYAPVFVIWKVLVMISGRGSRHEWARTKRENM